MSPEPTNNQCHLNPQIKSVSPEPTNNQCHLETKSCRSPEVTHDLTEEVTSAIIRYMCRNLMPDLETCLSIFELVQYSSLAQTSRVGVYSLHVHIQY